MRALLQLRVISGWVWLAGVLAVDADGTLPFQQNFEPLYREALERREQLLGPDHPKVAESLTNLALLLRKRGDFAAAEPLLRRALSIDEKTFGKEDVRIARDLDNLGSVLAETGARDSAEPLYRRSLAILAQGRPLPHC